MIGLNNRMEASAVWYDTTNTVGATVKQDVPSALSLQLTALKNSTAEFFTAVKTNICNAADKLGNWIKNISFHCGQPEIQAETPHPPMQTLSLSQILLESAKKCLPEHLDTLASKLENKKSLQPDILVDISAGSLRSVNTQLTSISKKIHEPGSEGISEESENLLRKEVAQGKFSQLGDITNVGQAKEYLARPGFEAIFRENVGQAISVIREKILPELMKL